MCNLKLFPPLTGLYRLPGLPLLPACTAFPGSPFYGLYRLPGLPFLLPVPPSRAPPFTACTAFPGSPFYGLYHLPGLLLLRPVPPSRAPPFTACTGFPGSHSYRPKSPSTRPPSPTANIMLDRSSYCAHKTMTLNSMTLPTMFTNNFCACQSFSFSYIRQN